MSQLVGIVTSLEFAHAAENQMLKEALEHQGIASSIVSWDDASVDWTSFALINLRSAWNYHLHTNAFMRWLDHVDQLSCQVWERYENVASKHHKALFANAGEARRPYRPFSIFHGLKHQFDRNRFKAARLEKYCHQTSNFCVRLQNSHRIG